MLSMEMLSLLPFIKCSGVLTHHVYVYTYMYIYFGSREPVWQFASLRIQFCYTEPQIFSRVCTALENAFGNHNPPLYLRKEQIRD